MYSLVEAYQKTSSFAALTRSYCDTSQLSNINRTRALYMKESLFTRPSFFLYFIIVNYYPTIPNIQVQSVQSEDLNGAKILQLIF